MNSLGKTFKNFVLLAAAAALAFPALSAAATVKTIRHHSQNAKRRKHSTISPPPRKTTARSRTAGTVSHGTHSRTPYRTHARSRKGRTHHRKAASQSKVHFASIHMQPERAQQIQQALIKAGDLHEAPTGRWDSQTREAMRQYQQQNGFGSTGLPDAKSLMKLGLGPHPLPVDADPIAQAKSFPPTTPGEKPADAGSQQDQPEN